MSNSGFVLTLFLLATMALSFSSSGSADETEQRPAELELKTERVVVFKDGYCMVIKKGAAKTDADGRVFTEEVPDAAVLGSFWTIPLTDDVNLKSTVAGWEENKVESESEVDCVSMFEILEANIGKICSFEYLDKEYSGEILKVLTRSQVVAADVGTLDSMGLQSLLSHRSFSAAPHLSSHVQIQPTISLNRNSGEMFLVRTGTTDMLVPAGSVQHLSIDDMVSTRNQTFTETLKQKRLTFQFDKPDSEIEVSIMYFRPGVRWIPTYRVELTDLEFAGRNRENVKRLDSDNEVDLDDGLVKRTARLSLQGEIINEAEDLIDMPIDVVVGVPNFRFRDVPSPLTLENTLRNVIAQIAPNVLGNNVQQMSNALYTQRSGEFASSRAQGGNGESDIDFPEELNASGGNDLFVYTLPKMSLKRGERATVPILATEVPYRDVYTWDIQLKRSDAYAATGSGADSPLVLSENKVWRQVELINETEVPWTTGAAMFMDGFQPLAQDLLTYTSPGGICRVPVTVAIDLRGKVEDHETDRELEALTWRGHHYAKVTGKSAIELANNKEVPVPVEVRLRMGGKAISTTDDGSISLDGYQQDDWRHGGDPVNNSSRLIWKSTIEPGECFKPSLVYEFFVRY